MLIYLENGKLVFAEVAVVGVALVVVDVAVDVLVDVAVELEPCFVSIVVHKFDSYNHKMDN
jgi:hypothetical protein